MKNIVKYLSIVGYVIVGCIFLFRFGHRAVLVAFPQNLLPIHKFGDIEGVMLSVSIVFQALLFGIAAYRLRVHVSVYLFAYIQAVLTIAVLLLHWAHSDHSYGAYWLRDAWAMTYLFIGLGACFSSSEWPQALRIYGLSRLLCCVVMVLVSLHITLYHYSSVIYSSIFFRLCIYWLIPIFDMMWLL